MYVAFISDAGESEEAGSLARDQPRGWRSGEPAEAEARALAEEGKAIVWIDSGLHATEVAPAQQSPELAYRMITGETAEIRAIRHNVILMQVPVINPDGLDWVAHWYRQNVGTPYELLPCPGSTRNMPGHDNNRDWFMLNLDETRHVTRLLFHEWFPQIVYNQHQAPPFPARIFVPPYAEPLNPEHSGRGDGRHQPDRRGHEGAVRAREQARRAFLLRLRRLVERRAAQRARLSQHARHPHRDGAEFLRHAAHLRRRAISGELSPTACPRGSHPSSTSVPGTAASGALRDAIDYMLTADFAILSHAAERRADYLLKSYQMARAAIDAGESRQALTLT